MAAILIVEDELMISDLAQMIIEDMGHTTFLAGSMVEANAVLHAPHQIDVLFTDIRLHTSALAGYELARQAIKLRSQLRLLYTSGSFATEATKALYVRGARYIQKPYSPEQLELAIQQLLAAPDPQTRSTPSP